MGQNSVRSQNISKEHRRFLVFGICGALGLRGRNLCFDVRLELRLNNNMNYLWVKKSVRYLPILTSGPASFDSNLVDLKIVCLPALYSNARKIKTISMKAATTMSGKVEVKATR